MRVIGIMSGSSLDGLDIVSVSFGDNDNNDWKLEHSKTVILGSDLQEKLKSVPFLNAFDIAAVESIYSHFVAEAILEFVSTFNIDADYVSIHGHTVLHLPHIHTSWQLLNGGMVASLTKLNVICDYRNQDMALEGQGTPMAVIADRDLFPGFDYYVNLGGIANISYMRNGEWKAYDICPCNQVNNYFAHRMGLEFDRDGALAKSGEVRTELLCALLEDEYISRTMPKSIDNTWIKNYWIPKILAFGLSDQDILCTFNTFIIKAIEKEVAGKEGQILFTGGGVKNKNFVNTLMQTFGSKYKCVIPDNDIVDYKEAILMAYIGLKRISGETNFIASATGAKRDVVGGALYLGR